MNLKEKVCENKGFCNAVMHSEDNEILKFNHYQKSYKSLFIISPNLECTIEKTDGCKNNPENLYTAKVSKHIPSGFSIYV